jgi:biotin transport system substrate-specific component
MTVDGHQSDSRGTRRLSASDSARVAMFAGLIAALGMAGSFSLFGNVVPITLQTLGVMLAGALLGAWRGALAVLVLLGAAAAGLPVLAGGTGGLGVFVGPTAGYLIGFVGGAAVIGIVVHRGGGRPGTVRVLLACLVGGVGVVYAFGIPVQAMVTGLPIDTTAALSLVFIPGDLIKAVVATSVVVGVFKAYPEVAHVPGQARRDASVR